MRAGGVFNTIGTRGLAVFRWQVVCEIRVRDIDVMDGGFPFFGARFLQYEILKERSLDARATVCIDRRAI